MRVNVPSGISVSLCTGRVNTSTDDGEPRPHNKASAGLHVLQRTSYCRSRALCSETDRRSTICRVHNRAPLSPRTYNPTARSGTLMMELPTATIMLCWSVSDDDHRMNKKIIQRAYLYPYETGSTAESSSVSAAVVSKQQQQCGLREEVKGARRRHISWFLSRRSGRSANQLNG